MTPASITFRRKSPPISVSESVLPLYVTAQVFSENTGQSDSTVTQYDLTVHRVTDVSRSVYTIAVRQGATIITDWDFVASPAYFERSGDCLCSTSTGISTVTISANNKTKVITLSAQTGIETYTDTPSGYVADTLGYACVSAIDGGIDEYGTQKPLFSSIDLQVPAYYRNTQSWLRSSGVTALPAWCNTWGGAWGNTLITTRNSIGVKHAATGVGETIRYVDMNGVVYDRTIASLRTISGADICVYTLNEDLPETIVPLKILGTDYTQYLTMSRILPMWNTDYQKQALVCHASTSSNATYWIHTVPDATNYPSRNALYEGAISGDSGSARGLLVGSEMVLTNCTVSAGSSGGPFFGYYIDQINAKISEMGSPYQLTEFDLSAFPKLTEL